MNKHSSTLFFFLAFTVSIWFGFLFAVRVEQLGLIHLSSPAIEQTERSQVNYLLIEVDSLTNPTPVFQSAWMVLRYQSSNQSALHMIRIDSKDDIHNNLQSAFSIKQNKLASKFVKILEKKGYQWVYFIVVDQESLKTIKQAFSKEVAESTENNLKGIFSATCKTLGSRPILSYPLNTESIKGHVVTNWTTDLATKEWEKLTTSPKPTRCEWYPTN